jgi:ketosteroid isomerase-like protein
VRVPDDDVEIARNGFETLADEGFEALLPLVHPDFEVTTPATMASEPDTYRGPDGVRRWFESFYEAMDEVELIPRSLERVGDGVVLAKLTLRARGHHSGITTEQQPIALIRIEDGLMRAMELFQTVDEARAASGAD